MSETIGILIFIGVVVLNLIAFVGFDSVCSGLERIKEALEDQKHDRSDSDFDN